VELTLILLDTNAYTAFKRNIFEVIEVIRNRPLIGLNSVILEELYGGFELVSREEYNRRELKQFLEISKINRFANAKRSLREIDCNTSEYYSRVYYYLRKKGNPIPTNDMWIAAMALQYNLALFSYDKHFRAVDGLITGNSSADFAIIRS
jgi:predicted nucleic acid-binding protein